MKNKKIKNEHGQTIGTAYNEKESTAEVLQEHLTIQDTPPESNYKGTLDAEIILKAGLTKSGRVWTFGKAIKTGAISLRCFDVPEFIGLLQGINGIYATLVYDDDGFPVGKALEITAQDLNERLKGNRICLLDNEPVKIRS